MDFTRDRKYLENNRGRVITTIGLLRCDKRQIERRREGTLIREQQRLRSSNTRGSLFIGKDRLLPDGGFIFNTFAVAAVAGLLVGGTRAPRRDFRVDFGHFFTAGHHQKGNKSRSRRTR